MNCSASLTKLVVASAAVLSMEASSDRLFKWTTSAFCLLAVATLLQVEAGQGNQPP